MTGVLVHTLVGMVPDLGYMLQEISAFGYQPFSEQMQGNHATQNNFDAFIDPCLGNDEHQQARNDQSENLQLLHESGYVAFTDGIIKITLPYIEFDLAIGIGCDNHNDTGNKQ